MCVELQRLDAGFQSRCKAEVSCVGGYSGPNSGSGSVGCIWEAVEDHGLHVELKFVRLYLGLLCSIPKLIILTIMHEEKENQKMYRENKNASGGREEGKG